MTRVRLRPPVLLAVAVGGAAGAVLRWSATTAFPDDRFPWTTLAINVVGSLLLALLPAVPAARTSAVLAAALGPGLLGGFTTFSAYAEQGRGLAADGHPWQALAYLLGTVAACLVAVHVAASIVRRAPDEGAGA